MGTGNTTITKAGGPEQGEKSAFQTPFFDGSRNGMSEQEEKRKANYDKVRRFVTEAEAAANKSHADAKNFGRSHGQSERMPFIVLVDYTARGTVPKHSTVKQAFYRRDKGGIEDDCTGRYHCYKKSLPRLWERTHSWRQNLSSKSWSKMMRETWTAPRTSSEPN